MRWAALLLVVEGSLEPSCDLGAAGGAFVQTSAAHLQRAVAAEGHEPAESAALLVSNWRRGAEHAMLPMVKTEMAEHGTKVVPLAADTAFVGSRLARPALERYRHRFAEQGVAAMFQLLGADLHRDFVDGGASAAGNVFAMVFVVLFAVGGALLIVLSLEDKTLDAKEEDMKAALKPSSGPVPRGPVGKMRQAGHGHRPISETGQSVVSIPASSAASSLVPPWPNIPHFCPELVVPTGHEAVLAVPLQMEQLQIKDLDGNPVIKAEVWPEASSQEPIVKLIALQGVPLAQCRLARSAGQSIVEVVNARNERYATILRVTSSALLQLLPSGQSLGKAYMLAPGGNAGSGMFMLFGGNMGGHTITVVNEKKELLAQTEPLPVHFDKRNQYMKMRVMSNGDVGLILCALLSISVLERT